MILLSPSRTLVSWAAHYWFATAVHAQDVADGQRMFTSHMLSDLILDHWFELDFSIFNQPPSRCKGSKHATLSSWSEETPNVTVLSDYKNQISASFIAGSLKTQADMNINEKTSYSCRNVVWRFLCIWGIFESGCLRRHTRSPGIWAHLKARVTWRSL